jgi:hypothetical protein
VVAVLQDSLQGSQGNTNGMVATLSSFDHHLSALDAAMRPTQVPAFSYISNFCRLCFILAEFETGRASSVRLVGAWLQVRTHAIQTVHENVDRAI